VPVPHLGPAGTDPIDIGVRRDLANGSAEPTDPETASRWNEWVIKQETVGDNVAANVATADQTEGAERLMLFTNIMPMKVYARNSVVLWSDVERGNGHH
jgi:hypothetical protein